MGGGGGGDGGGGGGGGGGGNCQNVNFDLLCRPSAAVCKISKHHSQIWRQD